MDLDDRQGFTARSAMQKKKQNKNVVALSEVPLNVCSWRGGSNGERMERA